MRESGDHGATGATLAALHARALAVVGVGVTIADAQAPDLPLVWVNPAFTTITGYAPDEALGRNCRFLQGPDTDPAAVDAIQAALRAGHGCTVTLLNYRKDGAPFWVELTLSPVRDGYDGYDGDDGSEGTGMDAPTHYIGVQADVTARVEVERARDRLLASAAHDLRSPLAALIGTVQLHRRRLDRGRALDAAGQGAQLDTFGDLLARLLSTVDEIGDAAQLQMSQALALRPDALDAGTLAREAARTVTLARAAPATRVRVIAPSTGPTIVGDRARLGRVLENVIGNALKYSPNDATVEVAVAATVGGVTITVRDRGVGIPADEVGQLFAPFYRASTAHGVAGTGLGLFGSKAIVEQHGGMIAVESAVGVGTTVTITLPTRVPTEDTMP